MRRVGHKVLQLVGRTANDVVVIEGGLGSQLLSMITLLERQRDDPHVQGDVSYFRHGFQVPTDGVSGLTAWPWELDRYGIELADFPPIRWGRRARPPASRRAELEGFYLKRALANDWTAYFPVVPETAAEMVKVGLADGEPYACLHVRRGDYLKVSARVVSLEESLRLAASVTALLPKRVLLLSDDEFTSTDLEATAAQLPDHECRFLSGTDQHASHGLMRQASVLITSNSTFSLSAGLLVTDPEALVITPQDFFGPAHEDVNRVFRSLTDWAVLGRRGS